MASREQILSVPCPTCKMPADSDCVNDTGGAANGYHNTRIYRFQVVSEAIAHNEEVMTEIAIHQPTAAVAVPDQPTPGLDLRFWAEQATAAASYAEVVCSTDMVPKAYFGKPAHAAAAILKGAELGFGPMASLNAFDNINGTPAPKAITLRAVVQGKGHDVEIVESTSERAVVRGRRNGRGDWQTSVWDIPRAQLMPQYKSNPNYKNTPAAMLVARATAEVCRWIASDAIMGMPYAAEEIDDRIVDAPAPTARRLTVAELDAAPTVEDEMMDERQRGHMFALWTALGYTDSEEDRKNRLWLTAQILGLESVESSNDLTRTEADRVIAALRERKARTTSVGGNS